MMQGLKSRAGDQIQQKTGLTRVQFRRMDKNLCPLE